MNFKLVQGLVSIIMPTYNGGVFIIDTIESIRKQTYTKWELIIIDDCSSDHTGENLQTVLKDDSRIQYYRLEKNSGAAVARNRAMEVATGEYMAFCDSDDLWMPDKLQIQIEYMQKEQVAFSCTAYEQIDESGRRLHKIIHSVPRVDYKRLLLDCPVGNSTVMYHVAKMGKFVVPNIRKRNDDALWLQMLKKEEYIYGIPKVLMQYRVRRQSLSGNKFSLIKYHWQLYRDIEHLSVLTSVCHIAYWCLIKFLHLK